MHEPHDKNYVKNNGHFTGVFQSLVDDVLRDMLHQFVYLNVDYILIFSRVAAEHSGQCRGSSVAVREQVFH